MKIRVLIADDHKIVRQGLRSLLEKEPDMDIIAEAGTGRMAIQLAKELLPHVVVMDMSLPEMNGIEATRHIVAEMPEVRVLALSMHSNRHFVVEALNAGAQGYLSKECAFEELAVTIRNVAGNEHPIGRTMGGIVITNRTQHSSEPFPAVRSVISKRERQVLQLLAEGKSTKNTAFALGVSIKTVETHRKHIMEKLNLFSIAGLTKYAIREGIVTLD
ncbi:MAG: LuxR family two component transcriptional [Geobacteraceae bacterium]|nr:MAG: LuxR family two component transcriptional [Geobacteraceae bacterium]